MKVSRAILSLFMAAALAACSLFSPQSSMAPSHPEALPQGRPFCSDCHENRTIEGALKPYAAFDHTPLFVKEHRFAAGRDGLICALCHAASFCDDCHASRIEIKPPTKLGNRPDRELIHRGDFLTRHRIEGKIDPAGCYKCHGRGNNEKCVVCHRN